VNRHYFWANFTIPEIDLPTTGIRNKNTISALERFLGFDLTKYDIPNKRQILRNCVNPQLGLHVLEAANLTPRGSDKASRLEETPRVEQMDLFDQSVSDG